MTTQSIPITEEHLNAGKEIIKLYKDGCRWSILFAQMQSGKTYTFLFVCSELLRNGLIESVVIFSGNAETDLKQQLVDKTTGKDNRFFKAYRKYLRDQLKNENEEGDLSELSENIVEGIIPKITVVWGTELNKFKENCEKTLFIWEEAHFAQNLNQCPDKFLTRAGISANGDDELLRDKNNYVLSVSATPFSELSDNFHFDHGKNVVYLKPGTGYIGVQTIDESGRLIKFTSVDNALPNALSKSYDSPKYALVRMSKTNEDKIISIIQANNWDFVIYDSMGKDEIGKKNKKNIEKGKIVWDNMKNAPKKNTVILLRNKCRMGKNLEKSHISFVMETAKNSKTDTVLQSLLGRVCGYPTSSGKGSDKIDVYLHEKIVHSGEIQRYIDFVKDIGHTGISTLPRKARNLIETKVSYHNPIIPIRIKRSNDSNDRKDILSDLYDAFTSDTTRINNKNSKKVMEEVVEKIKDAWSRGKKDLKVAYLKKKETGTRTLKKANEIKEAFQNSLAKYFGSGCGIDSQGLEVNIWVSKQNIQDPELTQYIYVTAHVKNDNNNNKIPETTGKEVFAHSLKDNTSIQFNGGLLIELPIDSSKSVEIMKEYIQDFISISKKHKKSRSITSQWDNNDKEYKGILMNTFVEDSLLPGGEIYNLILEDGYELKLTPSTSVKVNEDGYKSYISISW